MIGEPSGKFEGLAVHTLAETADHLFKIGLTPKRLDTAAILRFEKRIFRKLRLNPRIRELYRFAFNRNPPAETEADVAIRAANEKERARQRQAYHSKVQVISQQVMSERKEAV